MIKPEVKPSQSYIYKTNKLNQMVEFVDYVEGAIKEYLEAKKKVEKGHNFGFRAKKRLRIAENELKLIINL